MEKVLLAFAGVSLLATLVPGPDTAVVIKSAVTRGRRAAVATAAGCSTGQLGWGFASLGGIAALLATSVVVFSVVKWVGVAYLCCLGIRSLMSAVRGSGGHGLDGGVTEPDVRGGRWMLASRRGYVNGLLTNALNPKTALFMSALLPQFVEPGHPMWLPFTLVAITATVSLTLMTCYGVVFAWLGDVLRRPAVKRTIEGITGVVLVSFGVRLAFERP
jgi:threonine/homoserine/homoserine lactone efflux protein